MALTFRARQEVSLAEVIGKLVGRLS